MASGVAIIGGGTIGAELALTLAETGRDVTVIEMNDELAAQGHFFYKIGLKHAILDVKENYHALLKTRSRQPAVADSAPQATGLPQPAPPSR